MWQSGTTPTTFRYTGQREEADLGIYYYNARWYDPSLGRFLQADTIIPSPYNPLDWDRYAYVRNNPINMIDPSGYSPCDGSSGGDPECEGLKIIRRSTPKLKERPGDKCGPDALLCLSNLQDRMIAVDGGLFSSLPSSDSLQSLPYENSDKAPKNLSWYEENRKILFILYGWEYVTKEGKITDEALIAILIFMEFGSYKNDEGFYKAALNAVSNQYHSIYNLPNFGGSAICGGTCTLTEQLVWMQGLDAFRTKSALSVSKTSSWIPFIGDARTAMAGIPGPYKSWGNQLPPRGVDQIWSMDSKAYVYK